MRSRPAGAFLAAASAALATTPPRVSGTGTHDGRLQSSRRQPGSRARTLPSSRGCRVITVSSGAFKTIPGWLRISLVVIVISRF
jgi:hypothetical protein